MHRQSDSHRWARRLGTAVLGGVLSAGALAVLPAEAATYAGSQLTYDINVDVGSLSEDGTYSDSGANGLNGSDANGLANGLDANGLANGLNGSEA
ncbi:MAG: hypothetical protein L0H24_09415, partial [Microlunatus sp.]|nr:hypothetical protein [Microlunatus sp.]